MTAVTTTPPRASRRFAFAPLGWLGWSAIAVAVLIFVPIAAVLSNVFAHGGET